MLRSIIAFSKIAYYIRDQPCFGRVIRRCIGESILFTAWTVAPQFAVAHARHMRVFMRDRIHQRVY